MDYDVYIKRCLAAGEVGYDVYVNNNLTVGDIVVNTLSFQECISFDNRFSMVADLRTHALLEKSIYTVGRFQSDIESSREFKIARTWMDSGFLIDSPEIVPDIKGVTWPTGADIGVDCSAPSALLTYYSNFDHGIGLAVWMTDEMELKRPLKCPDHIEFGVQTENSAVPLLEKQFRTDATTGFGIDASVPSPGIKWITVPYSIELALDFPDPSALLTYYNCGENQIGITSGMIDEMELKRPLKCPDDIKIGVQAGNDAAFLLEKQVKTDSSIEFTTDTSDFIPSIRWMTSLYGIEFTIGLAESSALLTYYSGVENRIGTASYMTDEMELKRPLMCPDDIGVAVRAENDMVPYLVKQFGMGDIPKFSIDTSEFIPTINWMTSLYGVEFSPECKADPALLTYYNGADGRIMVDTDIIDEMELKRPLMCPDDLSIEILAEHHSVLYLAKKISTGDGADFDIEALAFTPGISGCVAATEASVTLDSEEANAALTYYNGGTNKVGFTTYVMDEFELKRPLKCPDKLEVGIRTENVSVPGLEKYLANDAGFSAGISEIVLGSDGQISLHDVQIPFDCSEFTAELRYYTSGENCVGIGTCITDDTELKRPLMCPEIDFRVQAENIKMPKLVKEAGADADLSAKVICVSTAVKKYTEMSATFSIGASAEAAIGNHRKLFEFDGSALQDLDEQLLDQMDFKIKT